MYALKHIYRVSGQLKTVNATDFPLFTVVNNKLRHPLYAYTMHRYNNKLMISVLLFYRNTGPDNAIDIELHAAWL